MFNIIPVPAPAKRVVYETTDGRSHPDQQTALAHQRQLNLNTSFESTPAAALLAGLSVSDEEKTKLRGEIIALLDQVSSPKPRASKPKEAAAPKATAKPAPAKKVATKKTAGKSSARKTGVPPPAPLPAD
jgi:hypothetical protein